MPETVLEADQLERGGGVLESLRLYLTTFTLSSVLAELQRWWASGRSCFVELLERLQLPRPEQSPLDQVLPQPSG